MLTATQEEFICEIEEVVNRYILPDVFIVHTPDEAGESVDNPIII